MRGVYAREDRALSHIFVDIGHEHTGQQGDVFLAIRKWCHFDVKDVQPVIVILTKSFGFHLLGQLSVDRCDNADMHLSGGFLFTRS